MGAHTQTTAAVLVESHALFHEDTGFLQHVVEEATGTSTFDKLAIPGLVVIGRDTDFSRTEAAVVRRDLERAQSLHSVTDVVCVTWHEDDPERIIRALGKNEEIKRTFRFHPFCTDFVKDTLDSDPPRVLGIRCMDWRLNRRNHGGEHMNFAELLKRRLELPHSPHIISVAGGAADRNNHKPGHPRAAAMNRWIARLHTRGQVMSLVATGHQECGLISGDNGATCLPAYYARLGASLSRFAYTIGRFIEGTPVKSFIVHNDDEAMTELTEIEVVNV